MGDDPIECFIGELHKVGRWLLTEAHISNIRRGLIATRELASQSAEYADLWRRVLEIINRREHFLLSVPRCRDMVLRLHEIALLFAGSPEGLAATMGRIHRLVGSQFTEISETDRVNPDAEVWRLYHGTDAPESFKRFNPEADGIYSAKGESGAMFFSPSAEEASCYASGRGDEGRGRVYPVNVFPGKTEIFDLADLLENDEEFRDIARGLSSEYENAPTTATDKERLGRAWDERAKAELARLEEHKKTCSREEFRPLLTLGLTSAAIEYARRRGLDTVILRGIGESRGRDQVAVLNPANIYSALAGKQMGGGVRTSPAQAGPARRLAEMGRVAQRFDEQQRGRSH